MEVIRLAGGKASDAQVEIPVQAPKPPQAELWTFGVPVKVWRADDPAWKWQGGWRDAKDRHKLPAKQTSQPGSEATLKFRGTGFALVSNLAQDGGRADVYIDGKKSDLIADAYIDANTVDDDLWRIFGLAPGEHTMRIVVREDADPKSTGRRLLINRAIAYQE
jgi:hypothetical protein